MAIDETPVTLARLELQGAARRACAAVKGARGWSQAQIAKKCDQPTVSLKRLLGSTGESVTEEVCEALDQLCEELGLGQFHLAALREAWLDKRDDARSPRLEARPGRVRIGLPPAPAVALQPRPELLKRMVQQTSSRPPAAFRTVAYGNGGIGKTQLARAVWDQDDGETLVKVWVSAVDRSSVVSRYAQAAEAVQVLPAGYPDQEEAAARFLAWLDQTWMSWLIVIDDVRQGLSDLRGLWPPATPTGRTVVTTRRNDLLLPGVEQVQIGVFSPEESVQYLHRRLAADHRTRPDALDGAAELAEALGCLPIALTQAAAYIGRLSRTCASYLAEFNDQRKTVPALFCELDVADGYVGTVATTWALAIAAADRLSPAGVARPALELAAFLDSAAAPEAIWTSSSGRAYLSRRRPGAVDRPPVGPAGVSEIDAHDALRNLDLFSVITHTPAAGGDGTGQVSVHSLVQRVSREQLSLPERGQALRTLADTLDALWPSTPAPLPVWTANASAVLGHVSEELADGGIHPLYFRYTVSLADSGQPAAAVTVLAPVVTRAMGQLDADHPQLLAARAELASWDGQAGDAERAVRNYEQLLDDQVHVLGPNDPAVLRSRRQLANWRGHAGQPARAVAELENLLADLSTMLAPDDPDVLAARNSLASWRGYADDPVGAVADYEALVADYTRVLGPEHADTLQARSNHTTWRGHIGDAGEAMDNFTELVAALVRLFGPDHPRTLLARANHAYWRGRAGDYVGATDEFEHLQRDYTRLLGPIHPHTLMNRGNIAHLKVEQGDHAAAVPLLEWLWDDFLRVHGPNHPHTRGTRQLLDTCLDALRR